MSDNRIYDVDNNVLNEYDVVSLFGIEGEVRIECGAYGISFRDDIDWDFIESKIPEITGCNNTPHFCHNDNFISFWELIWNFNCEFPKVCDVVKKVDKG